MQYPATSSIPYSETALGARCPPKDSSAGFPVRRVRRCHFCWTCGDDICCYNPETSKYTCPNDEAHPCVETYTCTVCRATVATKDIIWTVDGVEFNSTVAAGGSVQCINRSVDCSDQLFRAQRCGHVMCSSCIIASFATIMSGAAVVNKDVVQVSDAVPYSQTVLHGGKVCCINRSVNCSTHLFKASCGHVYCHTCVIRAMTTQLDVVDWPKDRVEKSQAQTRLAQTYVSDADPFLVPPCPICTAAMVETPGCFGLHTPRMLPKSHFRTTKNTANVAFHRRDTQRNM